MDIETDGGIVITLCAVK